MGNLHFSWFIVVHMIVTAVRGYNKGSKFVPEIRYTQTLLFFGTQVLSFLRLLCLFLVANYCPIRSLKLQTLPSNPDECRSNLRES